MTGAKRRITGHINKYLAALFVAAALIPVMAAGICGCGSGKENEKLTDIQEEIARYREGEEFGGDASRYLTEGRPDAVVLGQLDKALLREDDHARQQICHLLADMGLRADPLYEKGGQLIRDESIVSRLAGELLSRQTSARDLAIGYLLRNVPAGILKGYGERLAGSLKLFPDTTLMLVVAKGKIAEAAETIGLLMENPGWAKEEATRTAAAALGDQAIEQEFIDNFMAEQDPKKKRQLARQLGYIGTKKTLTAIAAEMRTDLVIENPNVSRRSLRVFLIEALRFNFPQQTFLYDNAVNSDADYEVIEKFCEETFGIVWKRERPPFLWIEGFPSTGPGE